MQTYRNEKLTPSPLTDGLGRSPYGDRPRLDYANESIPCPVNQKSENKMQNTCPFYPDKVDRHKAICRVQWLKVKE